MAKTTYNRTLFIPDLTKARFELYHTDKPKWELDSTEEETALENLEVCVGVKSWTIISGEDAKDIEQYYLDNNNLDEEHESLVLEFADGSKRHYRNSHVIMFVF